MATLPEVEKLLKDFLSGRKPKTTEGYRTDLRAVARYRGAPSVPEAVKALLAMTGPEVDAALAGLLDCERAAGLAPATSAGRLVTLSVLFKAARRLGLTGAEPHFGRKDRWPRPDTLSGLPLTSPENGKIEELFRAYLGRFTGTSTASYPRHLRAFAKWLTVPTPGEAVKRLLVCSRPEAEALVSDFLARELAAGIGAESRRQRLTTLRGILRTARHMGLTKTVLPVGLDREAEKPAAELAVAAPPRALMLTPAESRGIEGVIRAFLTRRKPTTARNYSTDLRNLALWMGAPSMADAVQVLMNLTPPQANGLIFDCMAWMREKGVAPATCNRRLAAFKALFKVGRLLGVTTTQIDVDGEKMDSYPEDTLGPSIERVKAMFVDLERRARPDRLDRLADGYERAARNLAVARLLFNQGFRINEALSLDFEHLDLPENRVSILGKARMKREWITLSPKARAALEAYLAVRGTEPGPLFWSATRAGDLKPGHRFQRENYWRILGRYGVKLHGLRHAAITQALISTNGDIAKVRLFSRHLSMDVIRYYDDRRRDSAGEIAGLLDKLA